MKNIITKIYLIYFLLPSFLASNDLLTRCSPTNELYNKIIKSLNSVDDSEWGKNIIFYQLDTNQIDSIMNNDIESLNCRLPFFNNEVIDLQLNLFNNNKNDISVTRYTPKGIVEEYYAPKIKTYKIKKNKHNVNGVFVFSKKGIKGAFIINNQTYQIDLYNQSFDAKQHLYFLTNINNSPVKFNFKCSHDVLEELSENINETNHRGSGLFGCIDVAIEIDYYTYQSFNNYEDAIDWAFEMLAVAEYIYLEELDLSIVSNSAQVWEIEDPYINYIDDPENMLIAMRENWINNESLSNLDRHLVHLFSKRNNTGTGGIAFLNGVGSDWNGYGFSSNLVDVDEYVDLPVPYFFWNIYCLVHELGHNFGAKHTQWCGWPGGPIDNCSNIEEVFLGECSEYTNNPTPQVGTIMSYCHTWPFQSGGGIIMKFHDYVKESLMPYLGMLDLYDCDNISPILGCMDPLACNYNALADTGTDDCVYPEAGLDCLGICLNDLDNDGVCDEDEILFLEDRINTDQGFLFPNPAYNFINIKADNLSRSVMEIQFFNSLGKLIMSETNINNGSKIDISLITPGVYITYLLQEEEIRKQTIIIQ